MFSSLGEFNSPPVQGASAPQDNYIQPNLGHGLRIWWAYYWPTTLISSIILVTLTILLRKAWENGMVSGNLVRRAYLVLPYVVTIAVSVIGIRRILRKNFRSFRIALLPRNAASGVEPLPRSFQRTGLVWWSFIWRAFVYSLIFRFAGSLAIGMVIGILSAISGVTAAVAPLASQIVIEGAVGLFVIYSGILDEEFGDFRVTLVPREAVLSATSVAEPVPSNPIP